MPGQRGDVLLIVIDSLRADCFTSSTAPNLTRRIEQEQSWMCYNRAFSNAPWTLPSHASIFTGKLPREHTATAHNKFLPETQQTLAEHFQASGYETRLITNNPFLSNTFGMTRGFDNVSLDLDLKLFPDDAGLWIEEQLEQANTLRSALRQIAGESTLKTPINLIYKYLAIHSDRIGPRDNGAKRAIHYYLSRTHQFPEFVCFNFMEPHIPYLPPGPYKIKHAPSGYTPEDFDDVNQEPWDFLLGKRDTDFEALRSLYMGEITYLDEQLEGLFTALEEEERLDETLIVVCGDHGDHFGEHGLQGHVGSLHKELLHVPLYIRFPKGEHGGETVEEAVSLRQLFTSLIEWTGGNIPDDDTLRVPLPTSADNDYDAQGVVAEYLGVQDLNIPDEGLEEFDYRRTAILNEDSYLIESDKGIDYHAGEASVDELLEMKNDILSDIPNIICGNQNRDLPDSVRNRLEATGYIQ